MSKTRSSKNKGQRLQKHIVTLLRSKYNIDSDYASCFEGDITATPMGMSGVDVKLSPYAKTLIPFDIESKNQERLNLWDAIKQCEENTEVNRIPLLVFKKNRTDVYCCLKFEELLRLIK